MDGILRWNPHPLGPPRASRPGSEMSQPAQIAGQDLKLAGTHIRTLMPDSADDASLISRARGGDSEAFRLLVERYFRAAYSSAYAVLGNSSDAEEMAQETFVQVYAKLELLREPGALASWVWRIARDCALKHLRKHKRMIRMPEVPELGGRADSADAAMLAGEENAALREALEKIPDEMRSALLMKFWEELDYDQMAERTGLTSAALYQRVCRGLKQLKELMEAKS